MKLEQVIEKIKADQVKPNSTPQTSGQTGYEIWQPH